MNILDSERIASVLEKNAYKKALDINKADLIIANMCSVRQSAVDRVYGNMKNFSKLRIKNPNLKIILTGCILKKDKKKFLEKFDYVFDLEELTNWSKIFKFPTNALNVSNASIYFKIKPKYSNKFSALVPIMTGCNNFCSYCVVQYVRGREISVPADEIIKEVKNLIKSGVKEIWLLGQNVNSYKDKIQDIKIKKQIINFPKLLKMVNDIKGDFWIRFTSSNPKDFSDELIDVMANCSLSSHENSEGISGSEGKVTEYLNLPVQSGDNKILKKMNRPYTVDYYKNLVKKIRKLIK